MIIKKGMFAFSLAICLGLLMLSCSNEPASKFIIVKGTQAINIPRSFVFNYTMDDSLALVPIKQGEIIWMLGDKISFYLRYDDSYGDMIDVKADSVFLYVNNKLISIRFDGEMSGLTDRLNNLKDKELADLSSLAFSRTPDQSCMQALSRIAKIKPDVGLFLEEGEILGVISLFEPTWIVAGDYNFIDDKLINSDNLKNVELLWADSKLMEMDLLEKNSALKHLYLENVSIDSGRTEIFSTRDLETIYLNESDIKDLSLFSHQKNLKNLVLLDCPDLEDISLITNCSELQSLTLNQCEKIGSMAALKKLKSLTNFGLQSKLDQQRFDEIIRNIPQLEILELVECGNIENLSVLKEAKNLFGLVLLGTKIDFETIGQLKQLRYLSIDSETAEENVDKMAALHKELPNCTIATSKGFCMGSGWLLLILPLVLFFMVGAKRLFGSQG